MSKCTHYSRPPGVMGGPCLTCGVSQPEHDAVNHPKHYGGADDPYEAIKVIEAWGLGFCLGNTIKYICRAGKKSVGANDLNAKVQDLRKAQWYLNREIERLSSITDT